MNIFQRLGLNSFFLSKKDKRLASSIQVMIGSRPFNLALFKLALTPSGLAETTSNGILVSNERLEFLGDAILGSIIAEFLFNKYPLRDEGFLTETRSKLVNREVLTVAGKKIGLQKILEKEIAGRNFSGSKSLYGDILEAFIGAIYLDKGYSFTKNYVLKRLLINLNVDEMITTTTNYKSKVIEWSQKEGKDLEFNILKISGSQRFKEFLVALVVESEEIAQGKGATKKKAEQEASKNACEILKIAT